MTLNGNSKWAISPHIRPTYSQDGAVVLHIEQGLCYSLNVVAAQILLAIESSPSGITLAGIVGVLETRFEVPRQQLETDADECLEKLHRMNLIDCNSQLPQIKAASGG